MPHKEFNRIKLKLPKQIPLKFLVLNAGSQNGGNQQTNYHFLQRDQGMQFLYLLNGKPTCINTENLCFLFIKVGDKYSGGHLDFQWKILNWLQVQANLDNALSYLQEFAISSNSTPAISNWKFSLVRKSINQVNPTITATNPQGMSELSAKITLNLLYADGRIFASQTVRV